MNPKSTGPGNPSAERRLALVLGADRKLWPTRPRLSAKERPLGGRDIPRSDPGKADEGGKARLPAQMKKAGASRLSTD